jgi:hypothetical protein
VSTRPPPPRSPVCGTLAWCWSAPALPVPEKIRSLGHLADHRIRGGERTRSLHHRPRRPITAWRMATLALRAPVTRSGVTSSRARSHSIDDHGDRIRLHEPRGQPGRGQDPRAPSCRKGQSPRPCPHAVPSNITHPPMRPKPEGRPTPAAHDATAPMDGYRRGTRAGFRSLILFLAPAMLARMRRDAAWRLDFPWRGGASSAPSELRKAA